MRSKVNVLVLGCTGLLGSTVFREFAMDDRYVTCGTYRNHDLVEKSDSPHYRFDVLNDDVFELPTKADYIINCIGLIKPYLKDNYHEYRALRVNSIFPHELSYFAKKIDARVIHVTSDCVFSGTAGWPSRWSPGMYTENDTPDMIDLYGRTKSLGEPSNCMVLRTSIIGPETHSHVSLMDWVRGNDGGTINGYINHIWNGVTTKQYANICKEIIQGDMYREELYHVFSPDTVSKYHLAKMIANKFKLHIEIKEYETPISIDRTLATVKDLNDQLDIPYLCDQLATL